MKINTYNTDTPIKDATEFNDLLDDMLVEVLNDDKQEIQKEMFK